MKKYILLTIILSWSLTLTIMNILSVTDPITTSLTILLVSLFIAIGSFRRYGTD